MLDYEAERESRDTSSRTPKVLGLREPGEFHG